ncbi:MAG: D-alanyl-D-alanine carboxypeptidase [Pseudomonadota bacterium]|nr:D-alanyl-D-alanine carboxypeptidase [Pseudomonadota bacterium]
MKKSCLSFLFFILFCPSALAQAVAPVETAARQAFLIDANTNTVLYAKDADVQMPTSSMSKMMTIYLVFEALKTGKLKMDDMLPVSEHAWRQEGSRMYLNVHDKARVEDLIRGVVIQSGNDAAVVFAEALGSGSELVFGEMMNVKAKELGMTHSHFINATGLPDPQHYSTARDLATLALALIHDFPEYYHYFSELEFTYNNIKQGNRNPLLYHTEMHVDGLKTGHTDVGGFGLTASALRDGRRLVLVINGLGDLPGERGLQARADESAHVLDYGYREFGLYPVAKAGEKLADAKVWLGLAPSVAIEAPKDIIFTLPRGARSELKASVVFTQPIMAPISKGQAIGSLKISAPGMETKSVPLVAAADVPKAGFFACLKDKLLLFLGKYPS